MSTLGNRELSGTNSRAEDIARHLSRGMQFVEELLKENERLRYKLLHASQEMAEMTELTRQMAERSRVQDEIYQAQRADEARRIDAERFAREQAEVAARESAAAMPPPPSFAAPSPLQAPIQAAAPVMQPMLTEAEMASGDVSVTAEGEAPPWLMIALVAAGIGAVVLMGGKKGKRRTKR